MKTFKKGVPYILLGMLAVFFCWFFVFRHGVFASKVDWLSQHSVFPDYFRKQFYQTGSLFPEFAANIGGGQNIYNFSYYGLFNPVILFSYLLPFVKMSDYIMIVSVVSLAVSVMLLYRWFTGNGFARDISFLTAMYFLLSGPMIFQSYNQILFVNYMPFLCMALIGVDLYLKEKKTGFYTISIFLMILTSFYFSIGGMLVIVLYGIYRYMKMQEEAGTKLTFSQFFKDGVCFIIPMITAVLMSGMLLIPTAMALGGRQQSGGNISILSLLAPDISLFRLAYHPYGIGLTTFIVTVLVTGFSYRMRSEKILNLSLLIILTIPLFSCLLNGGLYVRDKVMIPFLPLLCYLVVFYLEKQRRREICFLTGVLPFLVTMFLVYVGWRRSGYEKYWKWMLVDGVIMTIGFLIFYRKRCVSMLLIPSIIFLMLYGNVLHTKADRIVNGKFYREVTGRNTKDAVEEILNKDYGFYRMEQIGTDAENGADMNRIWDMGQNISSLYSSSYNAEYQKFRRDTFKLEQPFRNFLMQPAINNPIFQKFMGVKYLLSQQPIAGYEDGKTIGNMHIYKNETVSPVAYATNQVISKEQYLTLKYPYNQKVLLDVAIVEGAVQGKNPEEEIKNVELPYTEYRMKSKKSRSVRLLIQGAGENEVLFLTFKVENYAEKEDVSVWLEGVRNKLTSREHIYYNENTVFHYTVPLKKGQKTAELVFGKGNYQITDMKCYMGTSEGQGKKLYQSEFSPDWEHTKGNRIAGTIDVVNDGYFITTIPYDSSFEVRVDGKKVPYEKVNTAFLGMKIKKGNHKVEMIYHAPGAKLGRMVSIVGFILLVLLKKAPFYRKV